MGQGAIADAAPPANPAAGDATALSARATALLSKMARAVRTLSYDGTLVYLHGNRLETLSLAHRVSKGRIQERLVSLNGPIRTVAMGQDRVLCALAGGQTISVSRSGGPLLLEAEGIDPAALSAHYQVAMGKPARIAARETEVVALIPNDDLRYGYRFHIDRETALPLKSDLIDRREQPLEQLMFTSVVLQPSDGGAAKTGGQSVRSSPPASSSGRWRFEAIPPGFQLVMHQEMKQPNGSALEHFLFTDRLSTYSLYVEGIDQDGLVGTASIGAVHAAGRRIGDFQVTAVGEVPSATVEAAVESVRQGAVAPQ